MKDDFKDVFMLVLIYAEDRMGWLGGDGRADGSEYREKDRIQPHQMFRPVCGCAELLSRKHRRHSRFRSMM